MTTIPVNFDNAVEQQPVANGKYELQITSATERESGPNSKNPGSKYLSVVIGFTGPSEEEQNAPTFFHVISIPSELDEPKSFNFKLLLMKRFFTLFGVPYDNNSIDTDQLCIDMVGCTAFAEVKLGPPNDAGDTRNELVVPRLHNEPRR